EPCQEIRFTADSILSRRCGRKSKIHARGPHASELRGLLARDGYRHENVGAAVEALVLSLEAGGRKVLPDYSTRPDSASIATSLPIREVVVVGDGADETRRLIREWINGEKRRHVSSPFKQSYQQLLKPRIALGIRKRGEPHLPVEPRLVRRDPTRAP